MIRGEGHPAVLGWLFLLVQVAAAIASIAAALLAGAGLVYQVVQRRPKIHARWRPLITGDRIQQDHWIGVQLVLENVGDSGARGLHVQPFVDGHPAPEILAGPIEYNGAPSPDGRLAGIAPGTSMTLRFKLRSDFATIDPVDDSLNIGAARFGARVRVGKFHAIDTIRPADSDEFGGF
jgi:hypothetical protein